MPDDILDVAAAALEGVTEGPWRTEEGNQAGDATIFVGVGPSLSWCPDCGTNADTGAKEAAFIVWARTGVPALVAELEAARAEVERLRARCEPQVYVTTPPCSEYGEGTRGEVRHPIGRCGDPNF